MNQGRPVLDPTGKSADWQQSYAGIPAHPQEETGLQASWRGGTPHNGDIPLHLAHPGCRSPRPNYERTGGPGKAPTLPCRTADRQTQNRSNHSDQPVTCDRWPLQVGYSTDSVTKMNSKQALGFYGGGMLTR